MRTSVIFKFFNGTIVLYYCKTRWCDNLWNLLGW